MPRIHILGASGSGTTTLGAALAQHLGVHHADADAFFWMPTDPPFTTPRPREERLAMLTERLSATGDWVFSGSAINWATPLERWYDLIVYLRLEPALRMERLRRRESARHGARIEPGGDMAVASAAFLKWAASYETAGPEQRSLSAHETWLAAQKAPALRLDASRRLPDLVAAVAAELRSSSTGDRA